MTTTESTMSHRANLINLASWELREGEITADECRTKFAALRDECATSDEWEQTKFLAASVA